MIWHSKQELILSDRLLISSCTTSSQAATGSPELMDLTNSHVQVIAATLDHGLTDPHGPRWLKYHRLPKPCYRPLTEVSWTEEEAEWEDTHEARAAERDVLALGAFSYDSDSEQHEILVDEAEPGESEPGSQPKSLEGPAITRWAALPQLK